MKLLIQFPTLARPEKFLKCLDKYVDMASTRHQLFFNVNCDADDLSMNSSGTKRMIADIIYGYHYTDGQINFDKNTEKISAINSHIDDCYFDFDIVICASDDMIPLEHGWDDEIASAMTEHFPDLDGCTHFNDGYTHNKLITFSILGRKLYEHFGYVYHPDYKSLYCDNEFTQEVIRLGKAAYINKVIIRHEHYGEKGNSNTGDVDFAAQKTLHYAGRDGQVFRSREERGFPKERITND